ncbi:MAG: hypothetical protein HYR91_03505 [Flavobacteriia bacterium]|nr:hypothetical protein [Flavobacteriia bacterium]
MKQRHFYSFLLLTVFFSTALFSQTQSIAYPAVGKGVATTFVTDYHCLGINTSALGWGTGFKDKKFTMGSSEFSMGMYSDSLSSTKLKSFYHSVANNITKKDTNTFDWNKQRNAAADYAQAGIAVFADYNWLGFSFQGKKFGGFAFNINENYSFNAKLNQQTSDIIFRGKLSNYFDSLTVVFGSDTSTIANNGNISSDTLSHVITGKISSPLQLSTITNGSHIQLMWNRSYNFGYGRKIIAIDSVFEIYGGIGGRFIQSMAMFNMNSDANGLQMYSSITPAFNINYGSIASINPSNFQSNSGLLPKSVGNGYGVDLSASVIIFKKLKVAASVNNIGSVTYTRNVYHVKDSLLGNLSVNGLSSYDVTKSIDQLLKDNGILTIQGTEKYVLKNASNFRFGASFQPFKFLHFGFDMIAPFNKENPGSIQNAIVSFGGEVIILKRIALSTGYYGGGIYQSNIPMGINFILKDGAYEFGISSRDILRFFTSNAHSISTAFGFARFRF